MRTAAVLLAFALAATSAPIPPKDSHKATVLVEPHGSGRPLSKSPWTHRHFDAASNSQAKRAPEPTPKLQSKKPWEHRHYNAARDSVHVRAPEPTPEPVAQLKEPWQHRHYVASRDSIHVRAPEPTPAVKEPWQHRHYIASRDSIHVRAPEPTPQVKAPWQHRHFDAAANSVHKRAPEPTPQVKAPWQHRHFDAAANSVDKRAPPAETAGGEGKPHEHKAHYGHHRGDHTRHAHMHRPTQTAGEVPTQTGPSIGPTGERHQHKGKGGKNCGPNGQPPAPPPDAPVPPPPEQPAPPPPEQPAPPPPEQPAPPPPEQPSPPPPEEPAPPPPEQPAPPPPEEPAPPPPPPPQSNPNAQAYLDPHNAARSEHGANPVNWDDNLASLAQQWVNGCKMDHSGGSLSSEGYGENLAAGTGEYPINDAVTSWVNEVNQWNPSDIENYNTLHFTQVVWKGTTTIGCAFADCPAGSGPFDASYGPWRLHSCMYTPPGNFLGNFPENVEV